MFEIDAQHFVKKKTRFVEIRMCPEIYLSHGVKKIAATKPTLYNVFQFKLYRLKV